MISQLLNEFTDEVTIATDAYYTLKHINEAELKDKSIYRGLDENARTWNIINYSLQCSYFVALGRIFDKDGEAFSIHRLLRDCIEKIESFSRESLAERKATSFGENKEGLENYLESADITDDSYFHRLKSEVAKHHRRYDQKIKPIRHKVFAHKEYDSLPIKDTLFKNVSIDDIEETLNFLHQLDKLFFQVYHNGKKSELREYKIDEEQHIKEDVNHLLAKIRA